MGFIKDNFLGKAEKDAAKQQAQSGERAIDFLEESRDQARDDLQPFRNAGAGILNPLANFVSQGPETELERTEGFRNIEQSAAAGGKLQSGSTLKRLTEFNSILNSRNRAQRFNELFNLATLGSNAAAGQATASLQSGARIGDTATGIGNALAAGQVGSANAKRGTVNSLLQLALI